MAKHASSGPDLVDRIKRLAIMSVFAEDEFMEVLVLKGGNALDLVWGVTTRASIDIDLSMAGAFDDDELDRICAKLESSLKKTFRGDDLVVFDVTFKAQPDPLSEELSSFWGGYNITFKVIHKSDHDRVNGNLDSIRKESIKIGGKGRIRIDISRFEFTEQKTSVDFDGYQVFVYSPAMIVAEKLRAICQQDLTYTSQVHKHRTPRAKDFVDICATVEKFSIETSSSAFADLVKYIFDAKRVPLVLLANIGSMSDYHKQDFASVKDTVRTRETLNDFDFYFAKVVDLGLKLHSLWHP